MEVELFFFLLTHALYYTKIKQRSGNKKATFEVLLC